MLQLRLIRALVEKRVDAALVEIIVEILATEERYERMLRALPRLERQEETDIFALALRVATEKDRPQVPGGKVS